MGNFLEASFLVRALSVFNIFEYPFLSYHAQNYFGIVIYLLLAAAICSLLAAVAYMFSLSSVQDSEKRSEYECGFEPFDSATRLPFDVHFYLVGILFLIFDVEIALLFPWVLGLHTSGWFSFYVVLGFIALLGVGFLYEWKRGALIWPSRQFEAAYRTKPAKSPVRSFETTSNALTYLVRVARYNRATRAAAPLTERLIAKKLARFPKVVLAFKKLMLARRLRRVNRLFLSRKFTSFSNYVTAAAYAEVKLAKYKKILYFFIKQGLTLSASCRVLDPRAETKIVKREKALFSALAPAAREYRALAARYKKLYKKFKNSVLVRRAATLPRSRALKVAALQRYLFLQSRFFGLKNGRAKRERKALRSRINPRPKQQFNRFRFKKSAFSSILVAGPQVEPLLDLLTNFLPETLLLSSVLLVLTFLALELGAGCDKRALALAAFKALTTALTFVTVLCAIQLYAGSSAILFGGYSVMSPYVGFVKLLTIFTGRFILVESAVYLNNHKRDLLEYPIVLSTAILFMLLLVGSNHLVSAFLSLVGFSLNLYVLILIDASSAIAREAGVKYFYLSTISSGLILYGTFLLYVVLGTGRFYEMQQALSLVVAASGDESNLLQLAISFILVGLFFKLSAFPGHLWAADVYEGSPDPITAFFMLPVKVAVLGFTFQLLVVALEPAAAYWQPLVAFSAVTSLLWGCFSALVEKKTKRFLAYSSINQIGFLLLGLSTASADGYRSTLLYLLLYTVMNVGFLTFFLNSCHFYGRDRESLVYLTDFRGFRLYYGIYTWSLAIILLSMAGIPPLAGFFGKYYLLLHAQAQGLTVLVITGLATSVISTYYYLRLIKIFWFDDADEESTTLVICELTKAQALRLKVSELFLWSFPLFAGILTPWLGDLIFSLAFLDTIPGGESMNDVARFLYYLKAKLSSMFSFTLTSNLSPEALEVWKMNFFNNFHHH